MFMTTTTATMMMMMQRSVPTHELERSTWNITSFVINWKHFVNYCVLFVGSGTLRISIIMFNDFVVLIKFQTSFHSVHTHRTVNHPVVVAAYRLHLMYYSMFYLALNAWFEHSSAIKPYWLVPLWCHYAMYFTICAINVWNHLYHFVQFICPTHRDRKRICALQHQWVSV